MSEIRFEYKGQKYSIKGSNFYTANGDLIRDKQTIRTLISAKNQWSSKPVGADNDTVDAKTVIDGQLLVVLDNEPGTQALINKALDDSAVEQAGLIATLEDEVAKLKTDGHYKGEVLCAYSFSGENEPVKIEDITIAATGSGYQEGDLIFFNLNGVDETYISAYAQVLTVGENGSVEQVLILNHGVFSDIEGTTGVTTSTNGSGQGLTVDLTVESFDGSESNLASLTDLQVGDKCTVIIDETAGNAMWEYIYTNIEGQEDPVWMPYRKVESAPITTADEFLHLQDGVLSVDKQALDDQIEVISAPVAENIANSIAFLANKYINEIQEVEFTEENDNIYVSPKEQINICAYEPRAIGLKEENNIIVKTEDPDTFIKEPADIIGGYQTFYIKNTRTNRYLYINPTGSEAGWGHPVQIETIESLDSIDNPSKCKFFIYVSPNYTPTRTALISAYEYNGQSLTDLTIRLQYCLGWFNTYGNTFDLNPYFAYVWKPEGKTDLGNTNLATAIEDPTHPVDLVFSYNVKSLIPSDSTHEGHFSWNVSNPQRVGRVKVIVYNNTDTESDYKQEIVYYGNTVSYRQPAQTVYKYWTPWSEGVASATATEITDKQIKYELFDYDLSDEEFTMKFADVLKINLADKERLEAGQWGFKIKDEDGKSKIEVGKDYFAVNEDSIYIDDNTTNINVGDNSLIHATQNDVSEFAKQTVHGFIMTYEGASLPLDPTRSYYREYMDGEKHDFAVDRDVYMAKLNPQDGKYYAVPMICVYSAKSRRYYTDDRPNVGYYYIYGESSELTNDDYYNSVYGSPNVGRTVKCEPTQQMIKYLGVEPQNLANRIELRRGDDLVFLVCDLKPTIEKVVKGDYNKTYSSTNINLSYVMLSDGYSNDIMRVITSSSHRHFVFGSYNRLGFYLPVLLMSVPTFDDDVLSSIQFKGNIEGPVTFKSRPGYVDTMKIDVPVTMSKNVTMNGTITMTDLSVNGNISAKTGISVGEGHSGQLTYSARIGRGLNSNTTDSLVIGRYNQINTSGDLFVVGVGSTQNDRRNGFVVGSSGYVTMNDGATVKNTLTANYLNVTGEITCGGYDFTYMMYTVNGNSTNINQLQIDVSNLNTSVSAAQSRADNAYNLADTASTSANTALTKTTDISYANNETTVANDLVVNGDLKVGVSGSEVNVITEINTAKASATQAVSDAATALSTANTADTNASTALTDAATAQGMALTALSRTTNIHVDNQTNNTVITYDTEMEGDLTVGANVASATLNVNGDANISGTATVTGNVIANNIPALPVGIANGDIYVLKATIADVSGVLTPTFTWVKEN